MSFVSYYLNIPVAGAALFTAVLQPASMGHFPTVLMRSP